LLFNREWILWIFPIPFLVLFLISFWILFVENWFLMGISSQPEICGNFCQCQSNYKSKTQSDTLFSPIKNKMKVLKKIKKRIGLGMYFLLYIFSFNLI
jgi:hypothetical protein